jgi:hypothetical protein
MTVDRIFAAANDLARAEPGGRAWVDAVRATVTAVNPGAIRDLAPEVLDDQGRMRVLPAAFWEATTVEERALFGHRHGVYSFPTVELVEYLRALIGDRSAIEIGAGHGVLAEALGIPATDSLQQAKEPWRSHYARLGVPPVPYGPHVVDCHASRAVRRYRPDVVIGCWVTHKYDPARHEAGGNEIGVDEEDILRHCDTYVVVGNEQVHAGKKIWARPHRIEYPPFVFSRAVNGSRDFVAVWRGGGSTKRGAGS